jgi:hypothetical protein
MTGPAARRIPTFHAAPVPSRSLVRTTSTVSPSAGMAAACSGDAASATTTTETPAGANRSRPASDRLRSSGQSVATRTTVATPTAGSVSRDGTAALAPYRMSPASSTVGGWAGSSAKSVPRSTIFQPAASISPRRRSASAQSRAARAAARSWAAERTSSGIRVRGMREASHASSGQASRGRVSLPGEQTSVCGGQTTGACAGHGPIPAVSLAAPTLTRSTASLLDRPGGARCADRRRSFAREGMSAALREARPAAAQDARYGASPSMLPANSGRPVPPRSWRMARISPRWNQPW